MHFKKISLITFLFILPLFLSACNFLLAPSGVSRQSISNKGVYKTSDNGLQWTEQNTLENSETGIGNLNTNQLDFDVFDSKILYRASDGGLFVSENAGDSWHRISDKNINRFALNPKARGIIYIASANQVYKTTDNGRTWQLVYTEAKPGISITDIAISYLDTSRIYILTSDSSLLVSDDWGESWQLLHSFGSKPSKKIIVNPDNSNVIFIATGNRLFRSSDGAKTWQELLEKKRKDMPGLDQYRYLAYAQKQKQLIYLSKFGLLKSTDNGSSWQKVTLISSPESVDINTFSFNPRNTKELYYTIGNILYHTVDNGSNWKTSTLPFPSGARASTLLVDPADGNVIYLGVTQ